MTTENNDQVNDDQRTNEEQNTDAANEAKVNEEKLVAEIAEKQMQAQQAIREGKTEFKDVDNGESSSENNGDAEGEQGEEIDQKLVTAAHSVGMTDEEIVNMATDNPKALEALADAVNKSENSNASESDKDNKDDDNGKKSDKEDGDTGEEMDLDNLDPEVAKVVGPLLKQIEALEKKVNDSSQQDEERRAEEIQVAINQDFDNMTEAFPVLGDTKGMTNAQFKLRESVLDEALAINALPSSKRNAVSWPDCLTQAATALLGKPKSEGKDNKSKKKSAKAGEVQKLFTQKPSGRKKTVKTTDGAKSEEALAEQIATIQASVRGAGD